MYKRLDKMVMQILLTVALVLCRSSFALLSLTVQIRTWRTILTLLGVERYKTILCVTREAIKTATNSSGIPVLTILRLSYRLVHT